jgi:ABC-type methionine transport system permease subunit
VGYYGAMFVGLPERFSAVIGAVWGIVFGLLAKQLLPKDSVLVRHLHVGLQLLLWFGLAILLVTLIVFCSFIVRELA